MKRKIHISYLSPAASVLVLCLTVGTAFAQTRPSQLAGTIKTKVGKLAVIEQPASATTIKGRILDSNNKPLHSACVVALPVTSYAALSRYEKEGQFELPWSPTWVNDGQPIYLIAKSVQNDAALVEIADPTKPVTIHLEPAATLTGKVIDPNGQSLPKYTATLSLTTEFKCRAPIFKTTVGFSRERIFSQIPYGIKYRLMIEAEGYQTKQLTVDATDRSKEVIDIGTITLQPQDTAKHAVEEHRLNPDLEKEFHDIYRLEAQEVIKLIKPPYVLGRQEYFPSMRSPLTLLGMNFWKGPMACFHWDGELECYVATSGHEIKLDKVLYWILKIPDYDFNLPKELKISLKEADWIVRADSPLTKQLRALEEIIYAELNRSIRFEKRKVEREVIVATGQFEFKPLSGKNPDWLYLYLNDNDRLGGHIVSHQRASISELLPLIADTDGIDIAIDDKTEPCEIPKIKCRCSSSLAVDMSKAKEKKLPVLLDNLAKQTGLKFKLERQPAQIWFVTEAKDN